MGTFNARCLEEEYVSLVVGLDGDPAGKRAGDAYLDSTRPVDDGRGTTWALTPLVLGDAELGTLRSAATSMAAILEKAAARVQRDPSLRRAIGMTPEQEELALIPGGCELMVPLARLDTLFDPQTGDFVFVGVATDGANGMTPATDVTRAVQATESYRAFLASHPDVGSFDLVDALAHAIRDTYESWVNASEGTHHPQHPILGIVDYPESARPDELTDLVQRMSDMGVYARTVDIRELRLEEAAGRWHLVDDEGPIDCVYRRATLDEMLDKPCPGADALVQAARRGLACLVGGFQAWPVSLTPLLAALRSDEAAEFLDPDELAFVRAHTLETHVLDPDTDLAPFLEDPSAWVARPCAPYAATSVVAGADMATTDDWWHVLLACAREGSVVQRSMPGEPVRLAVGPADDGSAEVVDATFILGLYLLGGSFAGVWARGGCKGANGVWERRLRLGCVVAHDA